MVKKNSLEVNAKEISFVITDFKNEIKVTYSGIVPNLFEEEKDLLIILDLAKQCTFLTIANKYGTIYVDRLSSIRNHPSCQIEFSLKVILVDVFFSLDKNLLNVRLAI